MVSSFPLWYCSSWRLLANSQLVPCAFISGSLRRLNSLLIVSETWGLTQALQQHGSPWCQPFTRGWLAWDVRYCLKDMFSNKNCTNFLIPPGWWKTPIFQYMCLVAPGDVKIWICNSESGNLISSGIKLGPPFCLMNQGNGFFITFCNKQS